MLAGATTTIQALGATSFTVDPAGVITSVGGEWEQFARQNGDSSVLADGVGVSM